MKLGQKKASQKWLCLAEFSKTKYLKGCVYHSFPKLWNKIILSLTASLGMLDIIALTLCKNVFFGIQKSQPSKVSQFWSIIVTKPSLQLKFIVVQFDKRRICTDLISVRSANKCTFYCQTIAFLLCKNLNLWIFYTDEIKPVQMGLLSNCMYSGAEMMRLT